MALQNPLPEGNQKCSTCLRRHSRCVTAQADILYAKKETKRSCDPITFCLRQNVAVILLRNFSPYRRLCQSDDVPDCIFRPARIVVTSCLVMLALRRKMSQQYAILRSRACMLDSRFLRGPARTSVCGWTRLHSLGHFLGQYPSEDDASPQSVLFQKYSD